MIRRLVYMILVCLPILGWGQNDLKKNWYKANVFYDNGEFEDAKAYYDKALEASPLNYKVNYNLANTLYRTEKFEETIEQLEKIVKTAPSDEERAWVFHNLGNAYLQHKKIDEAIDAYKDALRLNSRDEATRYNLAFAQSLKQEQDKQQQQDQQNQDQEKDDENQDDQKQDGDQKGDENNEKDGKEGDDKKEDGDKGDEKKQDDPQDKKDGKDDQKKDPQDEKADQPKPGDQRRPISKDEAARILDAAKRKEKQLQEKLDDEKKVGVGESGKIDW